MQLGASARRARWSTAPEQLAASSLPARRASFRRWAGSRWSRFESSDAAGAWRSSTCVAGAIEGRRTARRTARGRDGARACGQRSSATAGASWYARTSGIAGELGARASGIRVPKKLTLARVCSRSRRRRWMALVPTEEFTMRQARRRRGCHPSATKTSRARTAVGAARWFGSARCGRSGAAVPPYGHGHPSHRAGDRA